MAANRKVVHVDQHARQEFAWVNGMEHIDDRKRHHPSHGTATLGEYSQCPDPAGSSGHCRRRTYSNPVELFLNRVL